MNSNSFIGILINSYEFLVIAILLMLASTDFAMHQTETELEALVTGECALYSLGFLGMHRNS